MSEQPLDPRGNLLPLDNPVLVNCEYASEERLATRNRLDRDLIEGDNAEDVVFDAVREAAPRRLLEAGCGQGELTERIADELDAEVVAIDVSPRMVTLARERGVAVELADVQALPFRDAEFDCVVAAWLLYHIADRDLALRELARVLPKGGRLVASTVGTDNLQELWELLGSGREAELSFGGENGVAQLAPHFARVERREARGTVVFPDTPSMRAFVAANITRAHLAGAVPALSEPFRARARHVVYVAEK